MTGGRAWRTNAIKTKYAHSRIVKNDRRLKTIKKKSKSERERERRSEDGRILG